MTTIGFDGGGSASRFLIRHDGGEPEYSIIGESLKYTDLGADQSAKRFREILQELGVHTNEVSAIAISLSGASDLRGQEAFRAALRREFGKMNLPIHIESDSSMCLKAAYPEEEMSGLVVIAGTGSVYLARTTDGDTVKIGGWGRILGDEGSGYWIGIQAMKHYCRVLDGIEPPGALFDAVAQRLEALTGGDSVKLRSLLYANELKPAEFAPVVFESISSDETAHMIALEATNHVARYIEALCEQVADRCDSNIAVHGGLFNSTFFKASLAEQVASYELNWALLPEDALAHYALGIAGKSTG